MMSYIRESVLKSNDPLKILFLTPEKLEHSQATLSMLQEFYSRGLLARIVIDEAHCVSHWGRDFRQDYLKLGSLKMRFPTVPTMALTATATEIVRKDVIDNLKMNNCIYFQCSFNRPNLIYEVWEKKKRDDENAELIAEFIKRGNLKFTLSLFFFSKSELFLAISWFASFILLLRSSNLSVDV